MGVRKNQALLPATEKADFIAAVKEVKNVKHTYDIFVQQHLTAMANRILLPVDPAHLGPAFLPWHREYLRRFELELQEIDSSVTIPYWDWTKDNNRNPIPGSPWTDDFMGGDGDGPGGEVTTGPFAHSTGKWELRVPEGIDPALRRTLGKDHMVHLPSKQEVDNLIAMNLPYDSAPWTFGANGFRDSLEARIHNNAHMWVGGSMTAASSPNDPVFWLHHCNIDRLWARWQGQHGMNNYLPDRSNVPNAPKGHALNDPMWPWNNESNPPTPKSVLDYRALGYTYDSLI